jgi:hypothetical protein
MRRRALIRAENRCSIWVRSLRPATIKSAGHRLQLAPGGGAWP